MTATWVVKGNLKGPKGDKGETGKSVRSSDIDIQSNATVPLANIKPNTNVAVGDTIFDVNGEVFTVTAVSEAGATVGTALPGVSMRGPKGDKGEPGSDATVPIATTTVAGKVKPGSDFDISDDGTITLYKAIAINSFTGGSNVENGATVNNVNLSWTYSKEPTSLTLDGTQVAKTDNVYNKSIALTDLGLKANKTWTLVAKDARNASSTKTTSVTFTDKRYWGVGTVTAASRVNSAFVLSLGGNELAWNRNKDFTVNAGAGQYIYYAIPAAWGTPTFFVGGFEGGFDLLSKFNFTNASGYTTSYSVYKSSNANLGQTTVNVK